jgi:hypothetical protein
MQFLFLFLAAFWSISTPKIGDDNRHAYHISKTDMVFKPNEKSLQITMHIFIDDLEMALEKQGHAKLFVGTEREKEGVNALITSYLQKNLLIQANDKKVNYKWIGKEPAADRQALWVYLEVSNLKALKKIQVENKVLTEVYADQKNIVQITVPTKKQGYFMLTQTKTVDVASF